MVRISRESARVCGFRKPGGLYLVCPESGRSCGKLPLLLTRCPTCDAGIKPARAWTWIDLRPFLGELARLCGALPLCNACPLGGLRDIGPRQGLLWIGERFYATPADFLAEAQLRGISRRIPAVPTGFKLGETWVLLAHRQALPNPRAGEEGQPTHLPGIFSMFKPTAVEYAVRGDESAEDLAALEKRGISTVQVVPIGEAGTQEDLELDGMDDAKQPTTHALN